MRYNWVYNEHDGCSEECCPPDIEPQRRAPVPYVYPTLEEWKEARNITAGCVTCDGHGKVMIEDFEIPCPRCKG